MINESINRLKSFLYLVIAFSCCMLVGIIKTYAITFTDFTDVHSSTTLYVGYANNGNPISWPYNNSTLYQSNIISLDYVVNTQIVANTHYEFESHMLGQKLIGTSIYSVVDASGNTCLTDNYYLNFLNGEYPRWDFQCPSNSNGFTIHIQHANSSKLFNDGYMGWGSAILSKTSTPISSGGGNNQDIINNNNQNTEIIINNNNQNTQDIINNQDKNAQEIQDTINNNFNSCRDSLNLFDKNTMVLNAYINLANQQLASSNDFRTIYIPINASTTYTIQKIVSNRFVIGYSNTNYSTPQILTNVLDYSTNRTELTFTTPNDAKYVFIMISKITDDTTNITDLLNSIQFQKGSTATQYENYGEQICTNKLDEQNNSINGLNDTIKDDDIGDSTQEAADFITDFDTDTFGLTSIITAPLNLIQSLTSSTCTTLHLPLPYLNNKYLDLPCMTNIYQTHFGAFFTMYQTITYGIIAYWVIVRIFNQVKDFKNPEHDEIEVVDL